MSARSDRHVPLAELLERLEKSHEIEPLRSRTAAMLIARPRPGIDAPTLLVKHCEPIHVPSAEASYLAFERCDIAGRGEGTPIVPRPECWGADPPYVCTEFITSRSANDVLRDLLNSDVEADNEKAFEIAARAGATLARFHRALPLTADAEKERLSDPKFHRLARRLVGSPPSAGSPRVHLHTDFGTYNLIVVGNDEVIVVDLPGSDRPGLPEEDLGRLIDSVARSVLASYVERRAALVQATLVGYESESGIPVCTGDRRALVESFAVRHALLIVLEGVRRRSRRRMRQGVRLIKAARRRVAANR